MNEAIRAGDTAECPRRIQFCDPSHLMLHYIAGRRCLHGRILYMAEAMG